MIRLLVRLLLCAAFCAKAIASPDDELAQRFAVLLVRDDGRAIGTLATPTADTATDWADVHDVFSRYECIEIHSMHVEPIRATPEERLLRVTMHLTATTAGAVRRTDTLPAVWLLRAVIVDGQWRIASVKSGERQLVEDLFAAKSDAERRALLDPHLDVDRVAMLLAWNAAEPNMGEPGLEMIRLAREMAAAEGNLDRIEFTRQMEATWYTLAGRDDDAVRTALESLEACVSHCSPDFLSGAYFTAAVMHWRTGDLPSAAEYFRHSVSLVDSTTDARRAVRACINLKVVEETRGHLSSALVAADEAERISRRYGILEGLLDAYIVQSAVHWNLGNTLVAGETERKAYDLALKLQVREKIDLMLANLGIGAREAGDLDTAARYFRQVPDESPWAMAAKLRLGETLEQQGHIAEAKALYELVVARSGPGSPDIVQAHLRLSALELRDDPARALEIATTAETLSTTTLGDPSLVDWDVHATKAAALRAHGRNAEAEQSLERALAKVEGERATAELTPATHANFLASRIKVYHELLDLRLRAGRLEDALRLSDRLKGALLGDVRRAGTADVTLLLTDEERAVHRLAEAAIARLNIELLGARDDAKRTARIREALRDARGRWENLETALHARHDRRLAHDSVDPLQSPQALLPATGDVILDYVVAPERTTLFVLTRGNNNKPLQIDVHTIEIAEKDLQQKVERFLARLAGRSFDYKDDARDLYRLLLAPAAAALRNAASVGIVGDGPLWRLPFQALLDGSGRPLVARFPIFYAPSLTSLLHQTPALENDAPAVLAIGNPRFSDDAARMVRARSRMELGDLPEAAVEARQIALLYDRTRSRVLTGGKATEQAVKELASGFDVLHIAAHAVSDDAHPLYSGIVLARDSGAEDGLLEGREITRLDLHARLAVLSACNTAQGSVRPGEGLISLSWAFLAAGCPTIVAAQWRVPSGSTARLMVELHRELARGRTSVAEALRRAQLSLMKDRRYRHPLYWSAFVVVGAGRS